MIDLILFGTSACHLCEEAALILAQFQDKPLTLEQIDIAEQEQWQEKYALRIPVLYHPQTKKELGWPFTAAQVECFIDQLECD